jgi:hypothetical protein
VKKKSNKFAAALVAILLTGIFGVACDTPAENRTEEKIEDAGEAQGMPEDKAENLGEAATSTDTTMTGVSTDTVMTTTDTVMTGTDTTVTTTTATTTNP